MFLKIILPLIAGCFFSLAFPSIYAPQIFMGTVISLSLYFFCLKGKLKSDLLATFFYIFGIFLSGYYWIPQTISEFGEVPLVLSYLLSIFLPLLLMPHFFCYAIFYAIFRKKIEKIPLSLKNCLLAFTLTIFEYYIPQQFPAHIGHSYLFLAPHLGLAKVFGASIFSFFSIWFSLSIVGRGRDLFGIVLFLLFLGINFLVPLKYEGKISTGIRMVQANVGNFLKVESEKGGVISKLEVDRRLIRLSTLPSQKKIDLVIWPETSYPFVLRSDLMVGTSEVTPLVIRDILSITKSQLFFGGYDQKKDVPVKVPASTYNAAFLLDETGQLEEVYHKQVLLHFGEQLPFGQFNEYLIPYLENHMSFFAKGDKFPLFKLRNKASFISAICYEILYPEYIRSYLNSTGEQAQFIINLTNDSWYGKTSEPYQHLYLSHWRAVEFNIPLVRMTNTGISSILFPDGSESPRTKLYTQEILDFNLQTSPREETFYQKWGILPLCILFLITYLGMFIFLKKNIFILGFKRDTLPQNVMKTD